MGWIIVFFLLTAPVYAQQSLPTDDIVVKAANAVLFQMKANLKLTQDQLTALQPIVADNIAKVRNLQQSLEDGTIDGKTMYTQRQQLINEADGKFAAILTPDQMKTWINIENQ